GGVEGVTAATLSGATFTDANTAAPGGDFTITAANWGDGNHSTTGLTVNGSGGTYTVSGAHPYAEDGWYSFNLTVADDGGQTTTTTGAVAGAEAAPTVSSNGNVSAAERSNVTNTGSFSDVDDPVTISVQSGPGSVTQSGSTSGTWSWSGTAPEDGGPVTVVIK